MLQTCLRVLFENTRRIEGVANDGRRKADGFRGAVKETDGVSCISNLPSEGKGIAPLHQREGDAFADFDGTVNRRNGQGCCVVRGVRGDGKRQNAVGIVVARYGVIARDRCAVVPYIDLHTRRCARRKRPVDVDADLRAAALVYDRILVGETDDVVVGTNGNGVHGTGKHEIVAAIRQSHVRQRRVGIVVAQRNGDCFFLFRLLTHLARQLIVAKDSDFEGLCKGTAGSKFNVVAKAVINVAGGGPATRHFQEEIRDGRLACTNLHIVPDSIRSTDTGLEIGLVHRARRFHEADNRAGGGRRVGDGNLVGQITGDFPSVRQRVPGKCQREGCIG